MSATAETSVRDVVPVLRRIQTLGVGLGVIGWAGLAFAFFTDQRAFYSSFMFAFAFWAGLTLGAITLTYLHHTIRATWTVAIARILEAATSVQCLGYVFLLWVVLVVGLMTKGLYQWGNPELVAASELLQKKEYWLNPAGYILRGVFYFLFWAGTITWLNYSSRRQDATLDERMAIKRATFAAPLGVVHVVLLTLAATDWYMSLDPAWYSTIYGGLWMIAQILAILSLSMLIFLGFRDRKPYVEVYHKQVTRDLGTVLLGFTMFWTYFTLSQFLIIWSGNLPEEIPFFINRFYGGNSIIGGLIVLLQFFTPFVALLSVRLKRDPKLLLPVVGLVFFMRIIDCWWQIIPFFRIGLSVADIPSYLLDLGAWVGVGGLWLGAFTNALIGFSRQGLLLVRHDTRLQETKWAEAHHA